MKNKYCALCKNMLIGSDYQEKDICNECQKMLYDITIEILSQSHIPKRLYFNE